MHRGFHRFWAKFGRKIGGWGTIGVTRDGLSTFWRCLAWWRRHIREGRWWLYPWSHWCGRKALCLRPRRRGRWEELFHRFLSSCTRNWHQMLSRRWDLNCQAQCGSQNLHPRDCKAWWKGLRCHLTQELEDLCISKCSISPWKLWALFGVSVSKHQSLSTFCCLPWIFWEIT